MLDALLKSLQFTARARLMLLASVVCAFFTPAVLPAAVRPAEGEVLVTVVRAEDAAPVVNAEVRAGDVVGITNAEGIAVLRLPAGEHEVMVRALGYEPASVRTRVAAGERVELRVALDAAAIEIEAITVTATRTDRRIDEIPLRVEVLDREEIEEKLLMRPGGILMLLDEMSGIRAQRTSATLGSAEIRMRALPGRYTRILTDGLPLHGARTDGLGVLQIPPMDLMQVEVVKGAATPLYGPAALGGVINLVSRRPDGERELLLNGTSRGGTDAVLWLGGPPGGRTGYTLMAGAHQQPGRDVSGDGWADLPAHARAVVRPRLFLDGERWSGVLTGGVAIEDRSGGKLWALDGAPGQPLTDSLDSRALDAGLLLTRRVGETSRLRIRAAAAERRHDRVLGGLPESDRRNTAFAEVAYSGGSERTARVFGVAAERDAFTARHVTGFDHAGTTTSVFYHEEPLTGRFRISGSSRLDHHSEHGWFLNVLAAMRLDLPAGWIARLSTATGFFPPTALHEDAEAIGLRRLEPPRGLEPEEGESVSIDLGRTFGPIEAHATGFNARIDNPVRIVPPAAPDENATYVNADGRFHVRGTELVARLRVDDFAATIGHVRVRATESDSEGGRRAATLVPRDMLTFVGVWEDHDRGFMAVEAYYTGRQSLEANPYRASSQPYWILGFLAEARMGGRARVFFNAENLTDTRQTRWDPLLLPQPANDGRRTTQLWAPLEGRTFNGGIRLRW